MAGFFETLFGGGAEKEAAERNRAIAAQYGSEAQDYLKTGYATGTENLNKAIGAYDPLAALATKYNQAGTLNLDALGVNGPEAQAAARSSFTTTPGFDLTQKAALEAIDRRRAIGGMYASGNADQDTIDWVTKNLYEQQYAPWMASLERAGNTGVATSGAVAAGQAGGYGSLANLASQYSSNQAGVAGNVANQNVSASNLQAQGEASGAKNLLGAGLSLASLAFGGGMGGGGGGLLSGLSGMLGGGGGGVASTMQVGNQFFPRYT